MSKRYKKNLNFSDEINSWLKSSKMYVDEIGEEIVLHENKCTIIFLDYAELHDYIGVIRGRK